MTFNRENRDKAIRVLRQYMSGRLSNDDLNDNWPRGEHDLDALMHECIWYMYSDLETHYNKGKNKLDPKDKKIIARLILFLGTDQKYSWPPPSGWQLKVMGLMLAASAVIGVRYDWEWASLCFFGTMILIWVAVAPIVNRVSLANYKRHGNWEVWPFHTLADFEAANRNPRYLAGKVRHK